MALDEFDEPPRGGGKAVAKGGKKQIAVLIVCAVIVVALSVVIFWLSWGYINPGWNFKVFADNRLPDTFDDSLKIISETAYSKNSGLARWEHEIMLSIGGDPADGDIETLEKMCEAFNTIPGFPGINLMYDRTNASIIFATRENHGELKTLFETEDESVCALTSTTNNATGVTTHTKAEILIAPGGARGYRNSVILHECFHMVGFAGHTTYAASILNSFGPVSGLCAADRLAFMMMYCEDIPLGISYVEFETYFRSTSVTDFIQSIGAFTD